MIYIKNTDNLIVIPRYVMSSGPYTLVLENNLTHKTYSFTELESISEFFNYYKFECDFSVVTDGGEYSYKLLAEDNNELVCGIITVGDYKNESTQYNPNTSIIQYNG